MPIAPPAGEAPISYSVADVILDALIETGASSPGEGLDDPDVAQWVFRKLNYLVDVWSARKPFVWSYVYNVYTLTPGLSPHTIGNSGAATFDTSPNPRPTKLESAALLLNSSSSTGLVDQPMNIRDHNWWALQQTKAIQTNVPTDVYYDPTFPDGSLYFWPVPNSNQQVRLQFWQAISQFDSIDDPIGGPAGPGTLPPAYRAAMMLSLTEDIGPGLNKTIKPETHEAAMKARKAVFGNNDKSPRMRTQDSGMPKSGRSKADFNWATGGFPGGPPE